MHELTFKLYSPLTAEFLPDDNRFWQEDELVELSGYELSDYATAISEQIEREGDHLEQYLDDENDPYLAAHVKSIRISVEERGGELCGCATVVVDEDLTERGWNDLQGYLSGQYSDGRGEGFEQRDIAVENGCLNVHFWQPDDFEFRVVPVECKSQVERSAADVTAAGGGNRIRRPDKKYKITDIAHPVYPELHRIRALRQVTKTVGPGTMGGYIQSENNLSQEKDRAWIYGEAICCDDARVTKNAALTGHAYVCESALVCGETEIGDSACVKDDAVVMAGTVKGNARVCGSGLVTKNFGTEYAPVCAGLPAVAGWAVSGAGRPHRAGRLQRNCP